MDEDYFAKKIKITNMDVTRRFIFFVINMIKDFKYLIIYFLLQNINNIKKI